MNVLRRANFLFFLHQWSKKNFCWSAVNHQADGNLRSAYIHQFKVKQSRNELTCKWLHLQNHFQKWLSLSMFINRKVGTSLAYHFSLIHKIAKMIYWPHEHRKVHQKTEYIFQVKFTSNCISTFVPVTKKKKEKKNLHRKQGNKWSLNPSRVKQKSASKSTTNTVKR